MSALVFVCNHVEGLVHVPGSALDLMFNFSRGLVNILIRGFRDGGLDDGIDISILHENSFRLSHFEMAIKFGVFDGKFLRMISCEKSWR
ncbi:hypothetical protein CNECB9_1010008 [Cupriavidus necator]|uniref:Uncharacterized protein n=1 Tax=Cupriavidus necator TaxID=106590 RepID=A0A1K0J2R4_CUPNE|nr:hypothetical protein CNECB9_1010008 [Cupriavidus necator]